MLCDDTSENEVWKDIEGYEGHYQVSDMGRVKSLKRQSEMILKTPRGGKDKYPIVILCIDGKRKTCQVHQLVAMSFLDHVPNGKSYISTVVDHIDNDKTNNKLSNLQILTQRENLIKDKKNKTSKFTGVCFNKRIKRWQAHIKINGRCKFLGSFEDEIDASERSESILDSYLSGEKSPEEIFAMSFKKPSSSKYCGVSYNKKLKKWSAYIHINNNQKYLGVFESEIEAFKARQEAYILTEGGI